jgi:hypothetical protein
MRSTEQLRAFSIQALRALQLLLPEVLELL